MNYDKVIIIDYGIVVHKSIFSLKFNPKIPVTFTACNIIIGLLYKLDIDPDSLIIIAKDSRNSWRKDFEIDYKGDRQEKRESSGIDFPLCYAKLNKLADELNKGVNWHFIEVPRCEADDIMAVACRYYNHYPVVLVTHDKDLEQCWEYPNVKIFSTLSKKWKPKPENFDYSRFIHEKIYKEATDNMVTPVFDEATYEARHKCVNLLKLPDHIESSILQELNKIAPKTNDITAIPFQTLQIRYGNIYNDKSKVVSYQKQIEKEKSLEERAKLKKEKEKSKIAKATLKEAKKVEKLKAEKEKLEAEIKQLKTKEKSNGRKTSKNSEPTGCTSA